MDDIFWLAFSIWTALMLIWFELRSIRKTLDKNNK